MIYVNILTGYEQNLFMHQLDKSRYDGRIKFYENSNENILWDYVVVYEVIRKDISLRCKTGGLIFMSGEPKNSSPYCQQFLDQFDHILSSLTWYKKKSLHHSQTALNYHYGYSYNERTFKYDYNYLSQMQVPIKSHNISMMCSNKTMMPGHILRYRLYQILSKHFMGKIDFFGSGIKFIDDKAEIIDPYRFHICIENSSEDHYWTEKIADSFLGYSVPIYYGATNIYDYFPKEAIIWLNPKNIDKCIKQIEYILSNPQKIYEEKLPYVKQARKLLLDKYNIFPVLEDLIRQYPNNANSDNYVTIKTFLNMRSYKLRMCRLRLRRFIFKTFHV